MYLLHCRLKVRNILGHMLDFNRFFFLRFHDVVFSLVNLALATLVTAYAIIFAGSFVLL